MTAATDDRFICRREGHIPVMKITSLKASGLPMPDFYITACARCGKAIEVSIPFVPTGIETPEDLYRRIVGHYPGEVGS